MPSVIASFVDTNLSLGQFQHAAGMGSSTLANAGASPSSNGVGALLAAYLKATFGNSQPGNPNQVFTNLAQGGYTTYHILPTGTVNPTGRPAVDPARNVTAALALSPRPGGFIISMPSNDFSSGYAKEEYLDNLDKVVAAIKADDAAKGLNSWILIPTPQPRHSSGMTAAAKQGLADAAAVMLSKYSGANNVWSVDVFNPLKAAGTIADLAAAYNSGDATHLNNAGHLLLRQIITTRTDVIMNATIRVGKYQLERGLSASGPFTVLADLGRVQTRYTDTTAAASTTYYYRVRAFDTSGKPSSDYSSVASVAVPAAPTIVQPSAEPGLRFWWDAEDFTVANGAAIPSFNEKSSSAYAVTIDATTTLITGALDGKKAVRSVGGAFVLPTAANGMARNLGRYVMFAVVRMNDYTGNSFIRKINNNSTSSRMMMGYFNSQFGIGGRRLDSDSFIMAAVAQQPAGFNLLVGEFDPAAGTMRFYLNPTVVLNNSTSALSTATATASYASTGNTSDTASAGNFCFSTDATGAESRSKDIATHFDIAGATMADMVDMVNYLRNRYPSLPTS